MRLILLFLLLAARCGAQNTFPPVGLWREHMPYQGTIDVTASESKVYAATYLSFFSVDRQTGEVERFSRVSGLSETGISTLQYDPLSRKLFVAYSNSNIDVLDASGIRTIPDIKRASLSGDKNIYHIYPDNSRCYLSTGIGIVVLDAVKLEVKESWFIGAGGSYVKVNGFTKTPSAYYAATEQGLKRLLLSGGNPADYASWQTLTAANGLAAASCKAVVYFGNTVVALQNDTLYAESLAGFQPFFANDYGITSIQVSEGRLLVTQRRADGASKVVVLRNDGSVEQTLQQGGIISFPRKAIRAGGETWVADAFGGLSRWRGGSPETYRLNSPENVALGAMTVYNDVLYATAGAVNDSWNYLYNRGGIFRLQNGNWKTFNQYGYPVLDSLLDFITVAVDPRDGTVWAGSYGGGLLHIEANETLKIFKKNSPLEEAVGDPGSYRVSGLAFDNDNNLWVANFGTNHLLHVRKNDGSWVSFAPPFSLNAGAVAQVLIDDANQKWIVSPLGNGLLVFDHSGTIDNPSDDKWRLYRSGAGLGNLPSNYVNCIARDKSGFIWVGTEDGIAVIQCPQQAFVTGCEAVLPVIKDGGFANYLFKGEGVRSIAVDGADRKWVATSNGAWLISRDGDKVLQHFTETSSPLLSNDVRSIAINGKTGEVFFATAKGISAFRGTATEAAEDPNNLLVFPNPVPSGYSGSIAMRGLPENAWVKITETNGRLVYQTRAGGGQAVWNGRDYKGGKAATGVYLVLVVNDDKSETAVGRIVFIADR